MRLPRWLLSGGRRGPQVGVALGPDQLTAVVLRPPGRVAQPETWSRPLESLADLSVALRELRDLLGVAHGTLRVALLPPLVQVKRVELPRLRADELRRVLTRDAGRYFLGPEGPRVIGVTGPARRRRSPVPYLVGAADAAVIEAVYEAAASSGWRVRAVVPAYAAWAAAARQRWPRLRRQDGCVVVPAGDRLDTLQLERGRLAGIRRFRPGALDEAAADALVLDAPPVAAARLAGHAEGLELVPERVRAERERQAARLSTRLLTTAAALLVLSAGLELWGAHRELNAVRAQRATIRAPVVEAMQVRDQLDALDARLQALAAAEHGTSRWTTALARLAERLPRDAYLLNFRGEVDSFVVEGVARHAAPAFEALGKVPEMRSVRATAPIRQEARDSAPPIERFTVSARLALPVAAPSPAR